jgi:hypothetical protein
MINNIERILAILPKDDYVYHLSIVLRKKEFPELEKNSVLIFEDFITSKKLSENFNYFKQISNIYPGSRIYLNLQSRKIEDIIFNVSNLTLNYIGNKVYPLKLQFILSKAYYMSKIRYKTFMIDYDNKPILNFIKENQEIWDEHKISCLPTVNGYHIIFKPFDKRKIKHEISYNSTILLYCKL